jgi:hypothetical protein
MGTAKHRNLTVDTLTVTGTLTVPEGALPAPVAAEQRPVAPHPLPLPEKTTNAALRDRVEFLTSVLIEAGLIHPVARPLPASEAPAEASTPTVQAEAVRAGVVDGA